MNTNGTKIAKSIGGTKYTRNLDTYEPCHFEADERGAPSVRVVNGGEGARVSESIRLLGLGTAGETLTSESHV
jgi:hypothetical protein